MTIQSFPGDDLRERREAMGLSIDDVYKKIRIPSRYVAAFETGALSELPAPCYAQGFLRTYCLTLELDPEPYIRLLDALQGSGDRALKPAPIRDALAGARNVWAAEITTWAAICGILVLGWVAYTVLVQPQAEPDEGQVQAETRSLEVSDPPDPITWP